MPFSKSSLNSVLYAKSPIQLKICPRGRIYFRNKKIYIWFLEEIKFEYCMICKIDFLFFSYLIGQLLWNRRKYLWGTKRHIFKINPSKVLYSLSFKFDCYQCNACFGLQLTFGYYCLNVWKVVRFQFGLFLGWVFLFTVVNFQSYINIARDQKYWYRLGFAYIKHPVLWVPLNAKKKHC